MTRTLRITTVAAALVCAAHPATAQRVAATNASEPRPARPPAALSQPDVVWRREPPAAVDAVPAAPRYSAFSPDGRVIAVTEPSRTVYLLDAAGGRTLERVAPESANRLSYSMAIANTGRIAVGRPGSMRIHAVAAAAPIALLPGSADGSLATTLAFSPDGSLLALYELMPFTEARSALGTVRIVDLEFETVTTMKASTGLESLAFAAPGSTPAGAGTDTPDSFRIWQRANGELPRSMLDEGWTVGAVPRDSRTQATTAVAVYRSGSSIAMREIETDRLVWAAPLTKPRAAAGARPATRNDLAQVEIAPNGRFLVSYEARAAGASANGAIVVRRTIDGAVVEAYGVGGVADLAIAPDSSSFVYTTVAPRAATTLARVPAL